MQPSSHVEATVERVEATAATPLQRAEALVEVAMDLQKQPRQVQDLIDALYLYEEAMRRTTEYPLSHARALAGRGKPPGAESMTERDLDYLLRDLRRLEQIIEGWDPQQQATVQALRATVEEIQAGAFRTIIRQVKASAEGMEQLKQAVADPWVHSVLDYHGILRRAEPSLEDRVRAALEAVRPTLASHSGDVELLSVTESEVQIRLLGTCNGCAHSDETVRLGIEAAIAEAAPSIERVKVVQKKSDLVQLGVKPTASPFSRPWQDVGLLTSIPEGDVTAVELEQASVLLTRSGGEVRAFPNACAHLGMPLDQGEVRDHVLTCRYHGFRFDLRTGECLTVPEVQLPRFPTRMEGDRVLVQVTP